ncbi:MAG: thioredoxin fold domain-containing protein [Azospirillaceae bacterium]|nr:thioredoxin fold domain-containing protein [Azospirillaceae bacterium]
MNDFKQLHLGIDRRQFITASAAAVGLAAISHAMPAKADTIIAPEKPRTREALLALLDDTAWVPIGPDNEKHIYVLGAPWCPHCKNLYFEAKKIEKAVQFRWVPGFTNSTWAQQVNLLTAGTRDANVLDQIYNKIRPADLIPQGANWALKWNEDVVDLVELGQPGAGATPVIYIPLGSELRRMTGEETAANFMKLASSIARRPASMSITPKASAVAGTISKSWEISRSLSLTPVSDTVPLPVRVAPTLDAPVFFNLPSDKALDVKGAAITANGEKWVYLSLSGTGFLERGGWCAADQVYVNDGNKTPVTF